MRPSQKIFGKRLKEAREKAYLLQRELAVAVGVIPDRIAAIEQSEVAGIDRNRVPDFAAALKMTDEDFIREVGAPADAKISSRPKPLKLSPSLQAAVRDAAATVDMDAEQWLTYVIMHAATEGPDFIVEIGKGARREIVIGQAKTSSAAQAQTEPARPEGKNTGKKAG